MSDIDEVDVEVLVDRIVTEALAQLQRSSNTSIILSYSDSDVLGELYKVLETSLGHGPEFQLALDEIRIKIAQSHRRPELKNLWAASSTCTKCGPSLKGSAELPRWNNTNPDLVLVNETSWVSDDALGVLLPAMKGAGFDSTRVGLTYINRCPLKHQGATEVANCLPYLFSELSILQPKVIAPIGSLAIGTFLGPGKKAVEVTGDVFWVGIYPVIPIVSPGYLFKAKKSAGEILDTYTEVFTKIYQFCYGTK